MIAVLRQNVISDERLVEMAQSGDRQSFVELLQRYHTDVYQRLVRHTGNLDAAEDLAQEVFLAAFRGLSDYRGSSGFRAWLMGIARHKALSYFRSEMARQRREQDPLAASMTEWWSGYFDAQVGQDEDEQQLRDALLDCMNTLPPHSRQMIQDYYFENQSAELMGRKRGRKSGAIRMMLLRIRRALGDCIREKSGLEDES